MLFITLWILFKQKLMAREQILEKYFLNTASELFTLFRNSKKKSMVLECSKRSWNVCFELHNDLRVVDQHSLFPQFPVSSCSTVLALSHCEECVLLSQYHWFIRSIKSGGCLDCCIKISFKKEKVVQYLIHRHVLDHNRQTYVIQNF